MRLSKFSQWTPAFSIQLRTGTKILCAWLNIIFVTWKCRPLVNCIPMRKGVVKQATPYDLKHCLAGNWAGFTLRLDSMATGTKGHSPLRAKQLLRNRRNNGVLDNNDS